MYYSVCYDYSVGTIGRKLFIRLWQEEEKYLLKQSKILKLSIIRFNENSDFKVKQNYFLYNVVFHLSVWVSSWKHVFNFVRNHWCITKMTSSFKRCLRPHKSSISPFQYLVDNIYDTVTVSYKYILRIIWL